MNTNTASIEPPQRSSRDFFNTESAINPKLEIPDFLVYAERRYQTKFDVSEISSPTFTPDQANAKAFLTIEQSRIELGNLFDATAKNLQLLVAAQSVISTSTNNAELREAQREKLADYLMQELWNPVFCVHTNEQLAKINRYGFWESVLITISAIFIFGSEYIFQASTMNGADIEPYIGSAGFIKALMVSFTSIGISLALKVALNHIPQSKMTMAWKIMGVLLLILAIPWFFCLVMAFQPVPETGDIPDTATFLLLFKALQAILAPLVINMIMVYLKKSSERNSAQKPVYDAHSLAVDEEIGSLAVRAFDAKFKGGYVQGFISEYQSRKEAFINESFEQITKVQAEMRYLADNRQNLAPPKLKVIK